MTKKIFAVSGIIFLIAASALVIYKVFLSGMDRKSIALDSREAVKDNKSQPDSSSGSEKRELVKVLDKDVKGATPAAKAAQVIYYENQKFLAASFEGKVRSSLGAYPFVKVSDIQWHPSKEKALINDNGAYYLYSLSDNSVDKFKENIDLAIWDSYGDRIIYKQFDLAVNKRKIEIAKPSGEDSRVLVEDLPFRKVDFAVSPNGDKICYYPTPNGMQEGVLNCIDSKTKEQKEIDSGRYGTDYLWSPDGKKVLVSFTVQKAGDRLALGVMSVDGGEFKGLNFSTSAKKCVWSKDNKQVFCSAMNGLPEHAILPNDWADKKFFSSDTFWRINTDNAKQTRLVDLERTPGYLDGAGYFLDSTEENLFFTDRKTGNLYKIKL